DFLDGEDDFDDLDEDSSFLALPPVVDYPLEESASLLETAGDGKGEVLNERNGIGRVMWNLGLYDTKGHIAKSKPFVVLDNGHHYRELKKIFSL
ncbi:unnamed protein product, partial [Amoebophrya sp. A25]